MTFYDGSGGNPNPDSSDRDEYRDRHYEACHSTGCPCFTAGQTEAQEAVILERDATDAFKQQADALRSQLAEANATNEELRPVVHAVDEWHRCGGTPLTTKALARAWDAYRGTLPDTPTCPRCDGTGLDPEPEADMDCGACGGSGVAT